MTGQIQIIAHPAERPELRLYVLALIALARQRQEPKDAAQSGQPQEAPHG